MKTKLPGLLIMLLALVAITACKKHQNLSTPGAAPPATSVFEGKVNGVLKSTSYVSADFGEYSLGAEGESNATQWVLYIETEELEQGTYNFGEEEDIFVLLGYSDVATEKTYMATEGTVSLIQKDTVNHKVHVTFSGTFMDLENENNIITVTDGLLKAPYTE